MGDNGGPPLDDIPKIAPLIPAFVLGGVINATVGVNPAGSSDEQTFSQQAGLTNRIAQLQGQIPAAQQGRITMAAGLVQDANGVQSVLIGTSEPSGYIRPGVTINPGETVVGGNGHAEENIVSYAAQNGLTVLQIGATRPICASCAAQIGGAGATLLTPLKGQ